MIPILEMFYFHISSIQPSRKTNCVLIPLSLDSIQCCGIKKKSIIIILLRLGVISSLVYKLIKTASELGQATVPICAIISAFCSMKGQGVSISNPSCSLFMLCAQDINKKGVRIQENHFCQKGCCLLCPVWTSQNSGHRFAWSQQAVEFFSLTRHEGSRFLHSTKDCLKMN